MDVEGELAGAGEFVVVVLADNRARFRGGIVHQLRASDMRCQ